MGAARKDNLAFATTERAEHPSGTRLAERPSTPPATQRMGCMMMAARTAPVAPTVPMQATSPVASSVEMPATWCADMVVFPGEKLASVDDFVRLRLQARSITFLGVLQREGIDPDYYAKMCERFADARRRDTSLEARYRARLEKASRRR
jgi:hypothetical protein